MKRVTMLGGPRNGVEIEIDPGVNTIRVPMMRETQRLPDRRRRFAVVPEWDETEYHVVGSEARWEGMIDDAQAYFEASGEAYRDIAQRVRDHIRRMVSEAIQELAPDKQVDHRKIWRVEYDPTRSMLGFRALVGPHRVRLGLEKRRQRKTGLPA